MYTAICENAVQMNRLFGSELPLTGRRSHGPAPPRQRHGEPICEAFLKSILASAVRQIPVMLEAPLPKLRTSLEIQLCSRHVWLENTGRKQDQNAEEVLIQSLTEHRHREGKLSLSTINMHNIRSPRGHPKKANWA